MLHRDSVICQKILKEISFALNAVGDKNFETFNNDELLKRGICMTVINIGELVKGLSSEFRLAYSNVPWKAIAGFRDIAAHKYHTLDIEAVYNTVVRDFRELEANITQILKNDTELK